ncbi:class I SAM-dependent methyltransferase [Streptomyces sp. NPDC006527]|uniref:class I SAM-dependent methyltransferase n=1 Tax=Streptomyces sp. NPDC006527 TaxID=3364749 RepID=UPI0036AFDD5C
MNGTSTPRPSGRRRFPTPRTIPTTRRPRWTGRSNSRPGRACSTSAGVGKLTATLVALGTDVIGVEPDPAMLTDLRRFLPAVRALPGGAEAIPLPDASVDAVLAGDAMHWFDMTLAGAEIARVLTPNGILASLSNVPDDQVEWVAELAHLSGRAAIGPRDTPTNWRAETADAHLPRTDMPARLGSPEQAEYPHGQRRTADSLIAAPATRWGVLVMPEHVSRASGRLAQAGRPHGGTRPGRVSARLTTGSGSPSTRCGPGRPSPRPDPSVRRPRRT